MAFCPNCGTAIPQGGNVCPNCGTPVAADTPYAAPGDQQQYQYQQYQQQYQQPYAEYAPQYAADAVPPGYDAEDIQNNRILSVCSYLSPLLYLIPLIAQPDSKYCRFHANQALVLILFELCCGLVWIVPILGWIAGGIGMIFAFVCEIIGIVRSLKGSVEPLPLIGKIDILH